MSIILGIDSTQRQLFLAFVDSSGECVTESSSTGETSGDVIARLDALCKNSGKQLADVSGIAVALGPGSYTGIRTGIATAQGLSVGLDIPVYGVSVFESRVLEFVSEEERLVALLTASKEERFLKCFDISVGSLIQEFQSEGEDWNEHGEQSKEFFDLARLINRFDISDVGDVIAISNDDISGFISEQPGAVRVVDCDISRESAISAERLNPALLVVLALLRRLEALRQFCEQGEFELTNVEGLTSLEPAYVKNVNAKTLAERGKRTY